MPYSQPGDPPPHQPGALERALVALAAADPAARPAALRRLADAAARAAEGGAEGDAAAALVAELGALGTLAAERGRRRELERRLVEQQRHLDEVQSIAGLGSWEWDIPNDRIRWSDQQFRLHGREPQPTIDYAWFFSHIHPDDQAWLQGEMQRILATGEAVEFPYRIVRPDGQERWLYARIRMVMGPDGAPLRMAGTSQDITATKLAEERLHASEESYRTIFEASNDAIMLHEPTTGALLDVNERACQLFGPSREEILDDGLAIIGAVPPFTPEAAAAYIARAADGETLRFEWCTLHRPSGLPTWLEVSLQRVTIRGEPRVLALVRDINDRKRVEAELRASEESYRTVFDASNDAIFLHDPETGAVLDINRRGCEILGRTKEEMLAEGLSAFSDAEEPYTRERALAHVRSAAAGTPQRFEWYTRDTQGQDTWTEVSLQRVSIGGADRVLATARDISERKAAERELRTVNEELERRVEERTAALAVANAALSRSEEHFRRLIENSYDLLQVIGADGRIAYTGPSSLRLLGYTPDEVAGGTAPDFIHPDDRARVEAAIAAALATPGVSRSVEHRVRHRDGSWRWMEAFARTLSPTSADEGVVANLRDVTERRGIEEALRASEARYRTLIEQLPAIVYVASLEPGNPTVFTSPQAERLLGFSPEEWRSAPRLWLERIHEDDRERVEALWSAAHARGERFAAEYRMVARDGALLWFRDEAMLVRAEDGAPLHIQGVMFDVTDRRQAEAALAEREEHFRRLIENSYDLVQVLDAQGRITYTGPSVVRLLGYTPEEIQGGTVPDFIHPDDEPRAAALVAEILAHPGTARSLEYRVRHKAGGWRWLEAFACTLSPTSAAEGLVANARDVTERKQAELVVRASEERFRALIENAHDITCILEADGTMGYLSPSVLRVLGYEPGELEGRMSFEFMHPDDVAVVAAELGRIVTTPGTVGHAEYRFRHKDGSWRLLEAFARTLTHDAPEDGLVANIRDVTERRRTEEALRQAMADAEQARGEAEAANVAKSEFLSRMSHELRTPMNSILGFAQILGDADLSSADRNAVQHILTAGEHLLNLINEVLDISRIEAGRQELSLEPVRLGAVVQEAITLVRPLAAARGVWVADGMGAAADHYVRADRQRLAQVLLNLLSNAVKYNRPGGSVRLGSELAVGDGGAPTVRVRVQDTGRGIPAGRRDQLFMPFARLGAEQSEVEGTGLGLALSQRLMVAMGGALELEHSSPQGSVFRLDLRHTESPAAAAAPLPAAARAAGLALRTDLKLLYVEDNLANLSLIEAVLAPYPGWTLVPALQGQLGVELAREHAPDLVLLDLHLPDIPGEEVLRRLRADPRTASLPVVIISADATPRTIERLFAAGADAYLTKPLNVRLFLGTLERLLGEPARGDA